MTQTASDISVIICAYTEKRWDNLVAAVDSVRQQTRPAAEIIIVIDHNPQLLKRVQDHISDVIVVENKDVRGLRGARNSGVAVSRGQIIAFLDDDALAVSDWLRFLCEEYSNQQVLGTGGAVNPLWSDGQPAWFPEEFYWVVGCTYRGMPQKGAVVRNPIGANMSFRREVFEAVGGFHSEIEKLGPMHAGGCEETELCVRARQRWPQRVFLYQPQACVFHCVPSDRTRWSYYCSRCFSEGISKACVSRRVGAKDTLASERSYTFQTLPQAVIRGLIDTLFHHDLTGFAKAGAIIVGLVVTTTGYFVGNILLAVSESKRDVATKVNFHRGSEVAHTLSSRSEF
jgi:GT2 family glycosyltransferase